MFTRYWRTYPWFLQLFLFAMMILTFLGLGSLMLLYLPKVSGFSVQEVMNLNGKSSANLARTAVYIQGIVHLFTFAIPCLLFAYLTHPKPAKYLGLEPPKNKLHYLLVPLIMIGLMMVILYDETFLTTHLKLSESLRKEQDRNNAQMAGLLSLKGSFDLVLMVFVMAVLPAFGEEFMFRGLFMRFAHKRNRRMLFPIVISAFFFMLVHDNPLGMPFIFIAGVVLGLIFWLTGSLWLSILAHFVFNGIQIAIAYLGNQQTVANAKQMDESLPVWMPLLGLVIFIAAGYVLIKTKRPLPPDWSDDFRGENKDNISASSPFSLS